MPGVASLVIVETLELLTKDRMEENRIEALWRAQFIDRQVRAAIEALFEGPDSSLVRMISKRTSKLSPKEIRASLGRCQMQLEFPLQLEVSPQRVAAPKPPEKKGKRQRGSANTKRSDVSVSDLIVAGFLRPPVALHCRYKKHDLSAVIQKDGTVRFGAESYDSLSTAAGHARATIVGAPKGRKYPQTNGWSFWKIKTAEGEEPVDTARASAFSRETIRDRGSGSSWSRVC